MISRFLFWLGSACLVALAFVVFTWPSAYLSGGGNVSLEAQAAMDLIKEINRTAKVFTVSFCATLSYLGSMAAKNLGW